MLEVTIYDEGGREVHRYDEVDFVSLINNGTYGAPPLIAPSKDGPPLAKVEDRVLYINTSLVPFFQIERISDRD